MKRGFGSDNHSGFSPEVMDALMRANDRHALAYGDDEVTARLELVIKETFGSQASIYLVFNGTGANVLCIDAMCRSHEAVVCAETAVRLEFVQSHALRAITSSPVFPRMSRMIPHDAGPSTCIPSRF